jgi:hypothetical protein
MASHWMLILGSKLTSDEHLSKAWRGLLLLHAFEQLRGSISPEYARFMRTFALKSTKSCPAMAGSLSNAWSVIVESTI